MVAHEEGTAFAAYTWSDTPRRKWIKLRSDNDGRIVPVERGGRVNRSYETYRLSTRWVQTSKGTQAGKGLTPERVRPLVDSFRNDGMT